MLRCLQRAHSPVFLLDGLLKRKLNILKVHVLYLGTSSVHLKSLKRGDSKVTKMSCYPAYVCSISRIKVIPLK